MSLLLQGLSSALLLCALCCFVLTVGSFVSGRGPEPQRALTKAKLLPARPARSPAGLRKHGLLGRFLLPRIT